jgi:hypothetical protein
MCKKANVKKSSTSSISGEIMNRMLPLLALALCFAGCGYQHASNVDPTDAGKVLKTALDAWKDGKNNEELAKLSPSIIMNESDWTSGNQLLEYKMNENGVLDGRQVRWVVQIKLQDKTGKVSDRKATYIVDTNPQVVIVRDTFAKN